MCQFSKVNSQNHEYFGSENFENRSTMDVYTIHTELNVREHKFNDSATRYFTDDLVSPEIRCK